MDIKVDEHTGIVFDLDDTIYNEIDYLKSAYTAISRELEPKNWEFLYTQLFSRYRNKRDVFEYLSTTYSVSKESLIQQYRNHIPDIEPFEGVLETFRKIKDKKGKIGIITDGRKISQMHKITKLGLIPFVDHIVISEEIGSEKPNEQNYRAIENNFNRKSYYYVADNVKKDFITPKQIGWQTIALIDQGLNIHSQAHVYYHEEYLPHNYISSFAQLNII